MKVLKLFFLLCFSFCFFKLFPQKENWNWYFGNYAALNFSVNPPVALVNSAMSTIEGCATISDASGNLLLYTDGETIWNKQHLVMANGSGLTGNKSASQSAVIVKQPGNTNIYIVFTLNDVLNAGALAYSMVDMNLASGNGSVTVKNSFLFQPCTEKLTSTIHCNGTDTWVVSHDENSANFRSYLVSSSGVNAVPVISSVGSVHQAGFKQGYMKISSDGKRLGIAIVYLGIFEVFDFDNSTGIVSNPLMLANYPGNSFFYGCEFSQDCSKFYAAESLSGSVYQWDLCAGSSSAIIASQYTVWPGPPYPKYGMQLGPDGKLYIAVGLNIVSSLAVISNPNNPGSACNYSNQAQAIGTGTSCGGLPNFPNNLFRPKPALYTYSLDPVVCQSLSFSVPPPMVPASVCTAPSFSVLNQVWDFGDPASGSANISTLGNPGHVFSAAGSYQVKLLLYYNCHVDTLKSTVTTGAPTLSVTGRYSICPGETTTLTASGATSYSWSNTAATSTVTLSPTANTIYTLTGTANGNPCIATKTVAVNLLNCTGLKDLAGASQFRLYPNPVQKELNIESETEAVISIYNEIGSLVIQEKVKGKKILQLDHLPDGIYLVKFKSSEGGFVTRFVKAIQE